jgi:ribosomal protein S18 acetylase RimI-like enzyme
VREDALVLVREMTRADHPGVRALETVFETPVIYDVVVTARRIELVEQRLEAPLVKRYDIADAFASWAQWDTAWVAEEDGTIVGFAASEFVAWHVRLVLWHLYVTPARRGQGIARALLERVEAHGKQRGATHVWLETSNVNVPGIAAYERLGYALCGADVLFYEHTTYESERAIYLAKKL